MSEGILVLCESADGKIKKTALELLSKATELAASLGGSVTALLVGEGDTSQLGAHGASKVLHVQGEGDARNVALLTRAAQKAVEEVSPAIVLGGASALGRDVFARLSIRLKAGLGAEITEMRVDDGQLVAIRPQFSGKVFSQVQISTDCKLFTVRPGSFAVNNTGGNAEVSDLSVDLEDGDSRLEIVEVIQSETEVVDLTEADRIVSGGRSVKSKENFDTLIRPLAKALGATAGASRAAVDSHYAEHSEQVGQTGKVVSPALYIACGISGAIQHLAGMNTSRVIVSINKDPNAPIFKHSTYGIVADMFDVVPVLTKALAGGEIPVVNMSKSKPAATESQSKSQPDTSAAKSAPVVDSKAKVAEPVKESAAKPAKKLSLKERLAAKRAQSSQSTPSASTSKSVATSTKTETKPASKSTPKPSTVSASTASASVNVASVAPVASADVEALRAEVAELKSLVQQLQTSIVSSEKGLNGDLKKYIKSAEDALKKEYQRGEKNAKAFQENASKSIEGIDKAVTNEVRRIREKTREAMANEGAESRSAIFSLKGTASANVVLNILILVVLIAMFMVHSS